MDRLLSKTENLRLREGLHLIVIPLLVILAAVVGTFVLGMGEPAPTAPTVGFDYDQNTESNEVKIIYTGGDQIQGSALTIQVNGEETAWDGSGTIEAGDWTTVQNVTEGDTVKVKWTSENNETEILSEYTAA